MNPMDPDRRLDWESSQSVQNSAETLTRSMLMKACKEPLDEQSYYLLLIELDLRNSITLTPSQVKFVAHLYIMFNFIFTPSRYSFKI